MAFDITQTTQSYPIQQRTAACREQFQTAVESLTDDDWLEACQGDFNLWSTQFKATLTGRVSLDHRVSDDQHALQSICNYLEALQELLKAYLEPENKKEQEASDGLSDEESCEALFETRLSIRSVLLGLVRVSSNIKWTGPEHRFKAADSTFEANRHIFHDVEELSRIVLFRDKRWFGRARKELEGSENDARWKSGTTPPDLYNHIVSAGWETRVHKRLICANLIRRNRIFHATEAMRDSDNTFESAEGQPQASQQTISTAKTESFDDYPPFPSKTANGARQCPFCGDLITDYEVSSLDRWMAHVAQDIFPFQCVYEDCSSPEEMYQTSSELEHHFERDHSGLRWVCQQCNSKPGKTLFFFDNEPDWKEHMLAEHGSAFSHDQISKLSNLALRTMIEPISCPLCSLQADQSLYTNIEHISGCLFNFSLLALPPGDHTNKARIPTTGSAVAIQEQNSYELGRSPQVHDKSREKPQDLTQMSEPELTASELSKIPTTVKRDDVLAWQAFVSHSRETIDAEECPASTSSFSSMETGEQALEPGISHSSGKTKSLASKLFNQAKISYARPVIEITDNGASLSIAKSKRQRRNISLPHHTTKAEPIILQIQEELQAAKVKCYLQDSEWLVPRHEIERILSPERILTLICHLQCFQASLYKYNLARDICFGTGRRSPFLRVFGALIAMNLVDEAAGHLDDDLSDACLPLRVVEQDEDYFLFCEKHGQRHAKINAYSDSTIRKHFLKWTNAFTATYIVWEEDQHYHYVLRDGHRLPIQHFRSDDTVTGIQQGHLDLRHDTYASDYKVTICNGHYDSGEPWERDARGYFTLRRMSSNSRSEFELELSSLLSVWNQQDSIGHLVHIIATFEEINAVDGHSTFYFLYDFTEGTVHDFWMLNSQWVGNKHHCQWMAEEFHGLAKALQIVHRSHALDLRFLPELDAKPYWRNGNITPQNVLWFHHGHEMQIRLGLSDFGLGRLSHDMTHSQQSELNPGMKSTYKSPELALHSSLVSSASDVFSLGCLFLDYISWFLLGSHSIEEFSQIREAESAQEDISDQFFFLVTIPGAQTKPHLKAAVNTWIQRLTTHPDCSEYLRRMLELIGKRMLHPEAETRIRVSSLISELGDLWHECRRDDMFYLGNVGYTRR